MSLPKSSTPKPAKVASVNSPAFQGLPSYGAWRASLTKSLPKKEG